MTIVDPNLGTTCGKHKLAGSRRWIVAVCTKHGRFQNSDPIPIDNQLATICLDSLTPNRATKALFSTGAGLPATRTWSDREFARSVVNKQRLLPQSPISSRSNDRTSAGDRFVKLGFQFFRRLGDERESLRRVASTKRRLLDQASRFTTPHSMHLLLNFHQYIRTKCAPSLPAARQ